MINAGKTPTEKTEELIVVKWYGPFTLENVTNGKFTKEIPNGHVLEKSDLLQHCGLCQIYGDHPVYGTDQLLYIGKSVLSFAERLRDPIYRDREIYSTSGLSVYLGYLYGNTQPSDDAWQLQIAKAEALLISANMPAYNSQHIRKIREWISHNGDRHDNNARVMNVGQCRRLSREASMKWHQIVGSKTHKRYR